MIKSVQLTERVIDVNDIFSEYKFAIPEHEPIKLSNGLWLHSYKVTPYNDDYMIYGDSGEEQDAMDREMHG